MTIQVYSTEAALLQLSPKQFPLYIGRLKRFRNTYMMLGTEVSGSTITCLPLPVGAVFAFGIVNCPTLGSSTLAISDGTNTYLAATTFTGGVATMFGATGPENLSPSPAPTQVQYTPVITVGAATLPNAGVLTVDFYVSTQD